MRHVRSLLLIIGFGLAAFALIGCPVWLAVVGYELAKHWGALKPSLWGQVVGCGAVFLLPLFILGNALRVSFNVPAPSPASPAEPTNKSESLTDQVVDIWKVAVDVQQHFNDLELQIRNFAVTMLAAVIGATAFAFKEHYVIKIGATDLSVAVAVLCAGMVGWLAFYFMDRYWYHNLLMASVKHSGEIEKKFESTASELGLSRAIGKGSPLKIWKFQIHSSAKIDLFYATGLTVLILMTMGAILAPGAPPTNDQPDKTVCRWNLSAGPGNVLTCFKSQ